MKAIIMAGGRGTRLLPVSEAAPKPMTRLFGLPLLEHITALLKSHGFDRLCMTLGHQAQQINEHFGDGSAFGVSVEFRTEDRPLGTAGGVKACMDFVGDDDFLVISGDAACDFDLSELFRRHRSTGSAVTMALYPHSRPLAYGTVVTDKRDRVISFIEKPSWSRVVTDLVNTGVYVISPEAMKFVPQNRAFDFARDLFPQLWQQGLPMTGVPLSGYWRDIGDCGSYLECSMEILDGLMNISPPSGAQFFPKSRVYRPSSDITVIGPSLICENVRLGPGSVIEHSILHPGTTVGAWSRIRNSVIDGGTVGEACVLEGTIVCRNARVFPMTVTGPGDVVAIPGAPKPPAAEPPQPEPVRRRGFYRELSCSGRAELMRMMSAHLWEAGADLSDGICLKDGSCRVRISPLADKSAISIEATGGQERDRQAACEKYSALAESFNRTLNS